MKSISDAGRWDDESQLEVALLGGGLPPQAEECLRQAGNSYQQDAVAEGFLAQAQDLAPGHPAVLIAYYRYYFYKNRLPQALKVAEHCLDWALKQMGLQVQWPHVLPTDAVFNDYTAVLPRFFLFSLKGYAYLHLRLGQFDQGQQAVAKLMQLDPEDKMNGSVLQGVLDRMGADDSE